MMINLFQNFAKSAAVNARVFKHETGSLAGYWAKNPIGKLKAGVTAMVDLTSPLPPTPPAKMLEILTSQPPPHIR